MLKNEQTVLLLLFTVIFIKELVLGLLNLPRTYLCVVPFSSYLTLNNIVTLKLGQRSLKIIQTSTIRKIG